MSKYLQELKERFPNIKDIKKKIKEILDVGGELAFKEIHGSNYERITNNIRQVQI